MFSVAVTVEDPETVIVAVIEVTVLSKAVLILHQQTSQPQKVMQLSDIRRDHSGRGLSPRLPSLQREKLLAVRRAELCAAIFDQTVLRLLFTLWSLWSTPCFTREKVVFEWAGEYQSDHREDEGELGEHCGSSNTIT